MVLPLLIIRHSFLVHPVVLILCYLPGSSSIVTGILVFVIVNNGFESSYYILREVERVKHK